MKIYFDDSIRDYVIDAGPTPWVVTDVDPKDDYTLLVSFIDGSKKIYDMKPLLDERIFRPLKDVNLFNQAHAAYDTVIWNDEIDIAPEELYEAGVPI